MKGEGSRISRSGNRSRGYKNRESESEESARLANTKCVKNIQKLLRLANHYH